MGNKIKGSNLSSQSEKLRIKLIEEDYLKRISFSSGKTNETTPLGSPLKNDYFLIFDNNSLKSGHKVQSKNYKIKEELNLIIKVPHLIHEGKGILDSKYEFLYKIGKGANGQVFVANQKIIQEKIAIKITEKNNKFIIDNLEIQNEIKVLKDLVHPNIVRIFEFYETPTAYYMITELCREGELYYKIKRGFSEEELSLILYQIFSALFYCNKNNIIHRDLKLENVLVNDIEKIEGSTSEHFWIKLIDFATAKVFNRKRNENTIIGTSYYMAPEVLKQNYNEKCDTWSAGVIMYILLVGGAPFDGANDKEIYQKIATGTFSRKASKFAKSSIECQDLINQLLEIDIEKRLSAEEALRHPWFTKYQTKSLINKLSPEKATQFCNNLIKYKIHSKIQQLIISFLVHNYCKVEENRDILKLYGSMDKEDNGRLTKEDLYNGLIENGINEELVSEKIEELFMMLDSDNDGYLEYEEFIRGAVNKEALLSEEMLQFGFKFLDINDSMVLTKESFKKSFLSSNSKISTSLCKKMTFEMNPEAKEISFEDFKQFMKTIE